MAMNAAAWIRQNKAVYFDNATSVRDYRVQLRGNRSVMLFGLYLLVLIGVAMVVYSNTAGGGKIEVVEAQRKLKDFYSVVLMMLGGLVSLVAPALTATSIVVERQRRSLDLVFSAPVTPKYFLVGKMMSSFRYTWMLLILALPVTAACVVLGGASWSDVLVAYLLLSLQGLTLTAMALMISTISVRAVSAVIWSYGASIVYIILTVMLSVATMGRLFVGGRSNEAPFYAVLNPFTIQYSGNTYTTLGTMHVPNWVLAIGVTGLLCKIFLLAGGTQLSPRPQQEIRSLRIHGLVYLGVVLYYAALTGSGSGFGWLTRDGLGMMLFWSLSPLFIVLPFLSTFGVDGERRFWPNGVFSFRRLLDGTPAGGLPYLLTVIATASLTLGAGFWRGASTGIPSSLWIWTLYTVGFWTCFWAIGRFAASTFAGLRSARTMQFAAFLVLIVIPFPLLSAIAGGGPWDTDYTVWDIFPLRAAFLSGNAGTSRALGWGAAMLVFGIVLAAFSEARTRRQVERLKSKYDGNFNPA